MELRLAQVVAASHATCSGTIHPGGGDALATGWSIDSRGLVPGDVFFAIHSGHQYVEEVLRRGAAAAVVSEDVVAASGPVLRVPDTVMALQRIAAFARDRWKGRVIGVTGSAGKTSTKDIIHQLLSVCVRSGKTIGNFNNHLGLPLSILRLPADIDAAVLEMGMNRAGEIRELARIAKPEIGVVTNVGYAHIEAFESIEGIASAKRELIEELPVEGVAVLNADDERVRRFEAHRRVLFGFAAEAEVRAEDVSVDGDTTRFRVRDVQFETVLQGKHSIRNILAGLAAALIFKVPLEATVAAVASLRPGNMRGERFTRNGIVILNDSYNANPEAMYGMIDVLRAESATRRIAVLGEMLELGAHSETLHRETGAYAAAAGLDLIVGVAGAARAMVEEAAVLGANTRFFETAVEAGEYLRTALRSGDAVLFKGSRGTHVEQALARIEL